MKSAMVMSLLLALCLSINVLAMDEESVSIETVEKEFTLSAGELKMFLCYLQNCCTDENLIELRQAAWVPPPSSPPFIVKFLNIFSPTTLSLCFMATGYTLGVLNASSLAVDYIFASELSVFLMFTGGFFYVLLQFERLNFESKARDSLDLNPFLEKANKIKQNELRHLSIETSDGETYKISIFSSPFSNDIIDIISNVKLGVACKAITNQ